MMPFFVKRSRFIVSISLSLLLLTPARYAGSVLDSSADSGLEKIKIPLDFPTPKDDRKIYLNDTRGLEQKTTLDSELQMHLSSFLAEHGAPISAVTVVEIKTGRILAMAQGRNPTQWGSTTHTALYNKFPAASLFKTVISAAAIELLDTNPDEEVGLNDGCGTVSPRGAWMNEKVLSKRNSITLRKAYGHSCNSYFAKIAVNRLGLGVIDHFARSLGWEQNLPVDFQFESSKFFPPSAVNSSTQTVGKYAAGFGNVGISSVHAAWLATAIANRGISVPLKLVEPIVEFEAPTKEQNEQNRVLTDETAQTIRNIMRASVTAGTASHAFGQRKYRRLMGMTGGKTGTLNGKSPEGLTTLFMGLMPIDQPEVAVSAIVVLNDHWMVKAPQLAAEALEKYAELKYPDRFAKFKEYPTKLRKRAGLKARRRYARNSIRHK